LAEIGNPVIQCEQPRRIDIWNVDPGPLVRRSHEVEKIHRIQIRFIARYGAVARVHLARPRAHDPGFSLGRNPGRHVRCQASGIRMVPGISVAGS